MVSHGISHGIIPWFHHMQLSRTLSAPCPEASQLPCPVHSPICQEGVLGTRARQALHKGRKAHLLNVLNSSSLTWASGLTTFSLSAPLTASTPCSAQFSRSGLPDSRLCLQQQQQQPHTECKVSFSDGDR